MYDVRKVFKIMKVLTFKGKKGIKVLPQTQIFYSLCLGNMMVYLMLLLNHKFSDMGLLTLYNCCVLFFSL